MHLSVTQNTEQLILNHTCPDSALATCTFTTTPRCQFNLYQAQTLCSGACSLDVTLQHFNLGFTIHNERLHRQLPSLTHALPSPSPLLVLLLTIIHAPCSWYPVRALPALVQPLTSTTAGQPAFTPHSPLFRTVQPSISKCMARLVQTLYFAYNY